MYSFISRKAWAVYEIVVRINYSMYFIHYNICMMPYHILQRGVFFVLKKYNINIKENNKTPIIN